MGLIVVNKAVETVQPAVRQAIEETSAQLTRLGIRHAIAGGVAVAAHGYLRQTSVADFLVGDEAFERHGALVMFKPGVQVTVAGVAVDYLSPTGLGAHVEEALEHSVIVDGLPVVPVEVLVCMKLSFFRRCDQNDVIELVRRGGADVATCHAYLARHAPDLVPRFEAMVEAAETGTRKHGRRIPDADNS